MTKRPILTDLTSLTNSSAITTLNQNWDALEQAFDNTLSRDGSTPNVMNADLDLNGNDLLNVKTFDVDNLTRGGQLITDLSSVPDWKSNWATATNYVKNDLVSTLGRVYICLVDHTSGVFATDLAASKWDIFVSALDSGTAVITFATRAEFITANNANVGLGLTSGNIVIAGGFEYRRVSGSTAISGVSGWVPNGDVTPQHFGAVADGVTNDQPAVDAAFTYMGSTGIKGFVPAGTYFLSTTVTFDCSAGFEVECTADTVFLASASFPVDNRIINPTAATGPARFIWRGGKIDGSLRPARVSGAPELLYIASANLQYVHVENVELYSNATRAGTAGDGCLFLGSGQDYFISGCKFVGAIDAGIYLSADATGADGRRAIIANNVFSECSVAIISKRRFQDHVITGNIIFNCDNGITIGGEADTTLLPGIKAVISNNLIRSVKRGIEARIANGLVISSNRIEDYGVDSTGTAVANDGIVISGSVACAVTGNVTILTGAFVPDAGSSAISIVSRTYDSTLYPSNDNLISGNEISGAAKGVTEAINCDRNNIVGNNMSAMAGARITLVGANSMYQDSNPGSRRVHSSFGTSGATVFAGSRLVTESDGDIIHNILTPNTGVFTMMVGDSDNNAVARMAYSHSSDQWVWRAGGSVGDIFRVRSDNVAFGTRTASADVPVTGYIEIRDLTGVIRRLAVVG